MATVPIEAWPAESASTLPDKTAAPFWKLFISPHTEISASTSITPTSSLFHSRLPGGGGSINLGQPSVQFLPLSELFVSAAESFIIKGSWFAGATSLFLRLFRPVEALKADFIATPAGSEPGTPGGRPCIWLWHVHVACDPGGGFASGEPEAKLKGGQTWDEERAKDSEGFSRSEPRISTSS